MLLFAIYLTLAVIMGHSFWRNHSMAPPHRPAPFAVDGRATGTRSNDR
jgi:hypothetical protein